MLVSTERVAFTDVIRARALGIRAAAASVAAVAMFAAVHSPPDRIVALSVVRRLLARLPESVASAESFSHFIVAPLRATLFVPSAAFLVYLLAREVRTRISLTRYDLRSGLLIFAALAALIIPFRPPFGVTSMGQSYAKMSVDPFNTASGWFYRRLLVPALAHSTGLSGPAYVVLATVLTFLLVLVVHHTISRALGSPDRLSLLASLSLCTSSFVLFNFQSPGYPDTAFLAIAMLLGLLEFSTLGVVAAVALALATHEVIAFLLVPILLFRYSGAARRAGLAVIALYCILMALSFRLNVNGVVGSQTIVDGKSSLAYLHERPWLAFAGVLASLKLLWIPVIYLIASPRLRWRARAEVASYVVAALSTLPFGVDTSRLAGMAAVGLVFHIRSWTPTVESRRDGDGVATSAFRALLIANIAVPTVYVGLNVGFRTSLGLYGVVWRAITAVGS